MPPLTQGIDHTASTGRVIDPANLTPGQRAGERCVYANCRRWLPGPKTLVGQLPDGSPVFACDDHEAVDQ
jgi:hypothetical protein